MDPLEQDFNNLKVIRNKIIESLKKGDDEITQAWKDSAKVTLDRMQIQFRKMGTPRTIMSKLIEDNLNLPG